MEEKNRIANKYIKIPSSMVVFKMQKKKKKRQWREDIFHSTDE